MHAHDAESATPNIRAFGFTFPGAIRPLSPDRGHVFNGSTDRVPEDHPLLSERLNAASAGIYLLGQSVGWEAAWIDLGGEG
jgi:hypothetical protein